MGGPVGFGVGGPGTNIPVRCSRGPILRFEHHYRNAALRSLLVRRVPRVLGVGGLPCAVTLDAFRFARACRESRHGGIRAGCSVGVPSGCSTSLGSSSDLPADAISTQRPSRGFESSGMSRGLPLWRRCNAAAPHWPRSPWGRRSSRAVRPAQQALVERTEHAHHYPGADARAREAVDETVVAIDETVIEAHARAYAGRPRAEPHRAGLACSRCAGRLGRCAGCDPDTAGFRCARRRPPGSPR